MVIKTRAIFRSREIQNCRNQLQNTTGDSQYGDRKDFDAKRDFMTWLHKAPTCDKFVCKKKTLHRTGVQNICVGHHTRVRIVLDPLQENLLCMLM